MTLLTLNSRITGIGRLALIAAAVAVALIAFGAPAVTEAAGGATQTGATSEVYWPGFLGVFGLFIDWLSGWSLCC